MHQEPRHPPAGTALATSIHMLLADAPATPTDSIQIDDCSPLDRFIVKTRNSEYELVVVSGHEGEILIRGGRLFPEFRQAHFVGSTAGGHALKMHGVYVGLCLEVFAEGRSVITSPVVQITSASLEDDSTAPLLH